jgi:signal transduction histidine kinase
MDNLVGFNEAEHRLLVSVLNSISDGVMVANLNGRFVTMNPAACRITGIKKVDEDDLDWSTLFGCFLPDGVTPVPTENLPLVRAMRGETTEEFEIILKNSNLPAPVLLTISGSPLLSASGNELIGGLIVFRDITNPRRIETEIRRSQEELQQFAYVAAHDLQEPLRTITGYLSLLQERCAPLITEAKADKYVTNAIDGTRRMQVLIEDLLAYSRISSKQQVLKAIDVGEVIATVLADLRASIVSSEATIQMSKMPTVLADRSQLKQVFQNLISNSIKYRLGPPVIKIGATASGTSWQFSVSDNGIGFDMEYAKRIFLIFQRLHGRAQYDGTGIGLAVCKRIIEKHGGQIWVESTLNHGATFFFTLPQAKAEDV